MMKDQMIKSWAHLPAYQRKAALESIRATAKAHRIVADNLHGPGCGPGRAPRAHQQEYRADALRIGAEALEAMALEVLRHDDA